MNCRLRFYLVALSFYFVVLCGSTNAQTEAQKAVCQRYAEADRCGQLVLEFYTKHNLLNTTPHSALDQPFQDTVAFANRLTPRAIKMQLAGELRDKANHMAESALQTISVGSAVNQLGATANSSGATSLVSKPTTTDFFSIAAESGAFVDQLSGNTVTLQANGLGMVKYAANRSVFSRWNSSVADRLQPLTVSATFNVSQSGSSALPTTGQGTSSTPASIASVIIPSNNASFSSVAVNYSLYRRYNPQDKTFYEAWLKAVSDNKAALDTAGAKVATAVNALLTPDVAAQLDQNAGSLLDQWHIKGAAAERNANFDTFVAAFAKFDSAYADIFLSRPDAPTNVLNLTAALDAFNEASYTVFNQARGKPLVTASYTYSTPAQKPATHDITIAAAEVFRGGKLVKNAQGALDRDNSRTALSGVQLSANFTTSIYASLPSSAKYGRLRALLVSGEVDKPFGGTLTEPRGILSFAGYAQYQYDPTVLTISSGNLLPNTNIALPSNAQVLLGTSGWIGVLQGKMALNLSKGLSLPLAVKWSNKTDLIKANEVRGQFGLDYDLSALSKLLQSKD